MRNVDTQPAARSAFGIWHYAVAGLLLAFLALHLPYLARSPEDLDSINFALGLREFDVARHQPHPPGYPLFIGVGRLVHAVLPDEVTALSLIGVAAGALSVIALAVLFAGLDLKRGSPSILAASLTVTAPLYWFTAVRPLSDTAGLAAALGVQALTVWAAPGERVVLAALLAGLATGFRSQVAWLTVPLLSLTVARCGGRVWVRLAMRAFAAFLIGSLVWMIPLVVLNGGVAGYARALLGQGAEDLAGVQMLWTTQTPRQLLLALNKTFLAPWAWWPVASVVIVCALAGAFDLFRRQRTALLTLAAAFGPYLMFDLLFQETATIRYALPAVPPVAFLAARGLDLFGRAPAFVVGTALAVVGAHLGGTSIAAYAREKPPAFRMLDDMAGAAAAMSTLPTLAMDRREDLDLRRPIQWLGDQAPRVARRLPAPPNHEWLELVKHWSGSSETDRPLWFVADPLRTDIDLVQHPDPIEYNWRLPYPILMGGTRPSQMRWYQITRPEWFVGEGWALTPEAAGVADADRKGLAAGPIDAWVARSAFRGAMAIGGRNLTDAGRPARITVTAVDDGVQLADLMVAPGAFLDVLLLGDESPVRPSETGYVRISVQSSPGSRVAVEQFDASARRPVFGFGDGWHEQEYNPSTGLRWRWLSGRGALRVHAPGAVVLHLAGESPRKYFDRPSKLVIRVDNQVVREEHLSEDFSMTVPIPAELTRHPVSVITLETDQTYIPADRSRRTRDRRPLGLRIFRCELRPAQAPVS